MRNSLLYIIILLMPLAARGQSGDSLHRASIVIDAHNDVLISTIMEGKDISRPLTTGHTDLPRLLEGGVDAQFFSVWCGGDYGKGRAFAYANRQIDSLMRIINDHPDRLVLATTAGEIYQAVEDNKIAALIGVEGGHMIEDNIDYLDSLYKRGARYLTLTWNNSTDWATSASDETNPRASLKHKGLSEFGRKVVRRMNELGMMVDLAHVGRQTFFDAIEASSKPVIVSHSNAYAIAPVSRNLRDDQIKAVAANGGVICVNFYSAFLDASYGKKRDALYANTVPKEKKRKDLSADGRFNLLSPKSKEELRPPLWVLVDQIDYLVKIAGIDHVGLGGDFDGVESTVKNLDDVSDYPNITQALLDQGYSHGDVKKILGANVLRVLEAQ